MKVRRFYSLRLFGLILMIVLFANSILLSAGRAVALYKQSAIQNSIIQGVQHINNASNAVISKISEVAREHANIQYDDLRAVIDNPNSVALTEEEMDSYFRRGYYNRLRKELGASSEELCDNLDGIITAAGIKNVRVVHDGKAMLVSDITEDDDITSISIENVTYEYTDPIIGNRQDKLCYTINIPDATFYTGNDDLFEYALLAGKGLYITGATSSIVGDIYAGSHTLEESRDLEDIYGEIGTYGGINILSTQLGVSADRIISEGDININGSFVIFEPQREILSCYGRDLNAVEGYADSTMYSLAGDFHNIITLDEASLTDYESCIDGASRYISRLSGIPIYYDSDNDENYKGPYRKIIANTDIDISGDFKGIIMTPYNVIVNNGATIEGLIISGDRVYMRGGNTVISSMDILREIVEYENASTDEYKAKDYIGGLRYSTIVDPDYYVVPYR